jgi:hypothetical protein
MYENIIMKRAKNILKWKEKEKVIDGVNFIKVHCVHI